MPRRATFTISAVGALLRELEYAPDETHRRQMDAAEELIGDIDEDRVYPEEFVIYRITGYRPEGDRHAAQFIGKALRRDLVTFVQALSEDLGLPRDGERGRAMTPESVAKSLGVSLRTVQRYRRDGLVFHWVNDHDAPQCLACFPDALDRFSSSGVVQPDGFQRLSDDDVAEIRVQSQALIDHESISRFAAAKRIAAMRGRAIETVRRALIAEEAMGRLTFSGRGPLKPQELLRAESDLIRGRSVAAVAESLRCSRSTVYKAIDRLRATRLRRLSLTWIDPVDELDHDASILELPAVTKGFLPPAVEMTAEELVLLPDHVLGDEAIDQMVTAMNLLKSLAARQIDDLGTTPRRSSVDTIERDLRWAAQLKSRIVAATLPAAITAIEHALHRRVLEQPPPLLLRLLAAAIRLTSNVVDRADPSHRHHAAAQVSQSMDRWIARQLPDRFQRRAGVQLDASAIVLSRPFRRLVPWWRLLPDPAMHEVINAADPFDRDVFLAWSGWGGNRATSRQEIARALGRSPMSVARSLRRMGA